MKSKIDKHYDFFKVLCICYKNPRCHYWWFNNTELRYLGIIIYQDMIAMPGSICFFISICMFKFFNGILLDKIT